VLLTCKSQDLTYWTAQDHLPTSSRKPSIDILA
jgi:hypothetical protein